MKRIRHTQEQIIAILKTVETGIPVPEILREHGVSQQTYYRWESKYGGLEVSEAHRLTE